MSGRRVIFRSKSAAPAAAPAALASMRMATASVLFVKAITPAPALEPDEFNISHPATSHMFDLVVKALHDGRVTARDASRASDAYMCGRPLPPDLIACVVSAASEEG
ncbi:hypothetical protein [Paraburkholderia rhynchosiae]|uniref:Uncharacterized protein n=1 Tax=Paraburkholderia rhynchosiae TaxID=487049 RepID=A0A2N7WD25_9BURK|nr:hypothetical protein [Paraburkholderia rhynchosiae]PMS27302.1 hypothetical protein C0Z16_25080 [Paraburkholderia rhynchosiae]CAB3744264.1 hypothetical protein LMG27174_07144 [Paraburkholderia rhynchosiae]